MLNAEHSAIILFAHGARDPEWAAPFRRMVARIRQSRPGLRVELAFLEFMQPALAEAVAGVVADGADSITLVPLFLAQGGHLKQDLPRLLEDIRQDYPGAQIEVTQAIGDSQVLTDAIADWALTRHLASFS
ncbi:MAG: CbiX/SirB N-terminal domain-containing protein [Burkholderiales bacterium]